MLRPNLLIDREIFRKAKDLLPIFSCLAIRIEACTRGVELDIKCHDSNDIFTVKFFSDRTVCDCGGFSDSVCIHIALALLGLNFQTVDENSKEFMHQYPKLSGIFRDFHLDRKLVANLITACQDRGKGPIYARHNRTTELVVYQCKGARVSYFQGRVVAFLCSSCGDVWTGSLRSPCQCVIEIVMRVLQ
jgi:hypothetical protein